MPIVPVSPYSTAGQIATLVRALANDQQGQLYTDTYILPYINSAYRQVQIALANVGKQTFVEDEYVVTIPAIGTVDPGLQVWLSFYGVGGNVASPDNSPTLPQELLEPLHLWERPSGSTDAFVDMVDMTSHGGLPSVPQTFNLRWWEWRTDQLNFVGAQQDTDIRIRFNGGFQNFTIDNNGNISGSLQVLGALDAVAYSAAAMALTPRGSPLAAGYDTAAGRFVELLVNQEVRAQQHAGPFRRRGFSTRYGQGRGWG